MRAMPCRFCGSMTGETCQTLPVKRCVGADRRDVGWRADRELSEVGFAELRAQLHLAASGDAEQRARCRR